MFLPTKAHIKEITEGQYRIRLGNRVPKDAVNLAYAHIPAVNSRENVLITDLSNTIMENTRNAQIGDIFMHPDNSLLLATEDGRMELPTTDVLITNIFQGETPLYYAQVLTYWHYDKMGPDEYGMYQGTGITIVDRFGKPIDRPYRVQLIEEPNHKNLYKIIVFTSFKDSESDTYSVVYNAVNVLPDGRTETFAGYRESLNLHRAFTRLDDMVKILDQVRRRDNSPTYYQANGTHPAYSKFYVPTPPIDDTRKPEFFRYQVGLEIEIKGEKHIFTTPWYSDNVFNINSLTVEERNEYVNGNKLLTSTTAEEIMKYFADKDFFYDVRAKKKYFVISDNDVVKVFTRLDGSSPVYATTNVSGVQRIRIPMNARRSQSPIEETGKLKFRIRPLKGVPNTVANISFVIDASNSIKRYDSDKSQRSIIIRDIVNSARNFHPEFAVNGFAYNYTVNPFQEEMIGDSEALIQKFLKDVEDSDITYPFPAIDAAIEKLDKIPEKFNRVSTEITNLKFLVLVTDGRYESFGALEEKIIEAKNKKISLCVVTFSNYEQIREVCERNQTLAVDALSPRIGTFLRYFFFDLAGLQESFDLGNTINFTISPDEGDKEVAVMEYDTFSIPQKYLNDKYRYGIEVQLEAHAAISIYIKDKPVDRILATYNSGNIIPINYMDVENVYHVIATSKYYAYKFNHTYALRLNDNQQIQVLPPREIESRYSWYLRIKNGRFERNVVEDDKVVTYCYSIPEYYRQGFIPQLGVPYVQVQKEKPRILNDSQIKVMYTPLYIEFDGEKVLNATVRVNGKPINIRSWSTFDGVFELDGKITQNDNIEVYYQYEEEAYVYRGYYDEQSGRFWSLDLNPTAGHYVTIRDKYDGTVKDLPSFWLINETIYLYLRPTMKMVPTDNGYEIQGIQKATLFHAFEKVDEPNVLLIAKIHVRPNSNRESIRFLDTRMRGGGLKPEINEAIMREFESESFFYWDIGSWDGKPYSENAVAVFRITRKVLKEYGGRFTKSEVEEKLAKHLGYGILPIIEFIEDSDELLSIPEDLVVEVIDVEDNVDVAVERPTFSLSVVEG
jgi:hypothetical protein